MPSDVRSIDALRNLQGAVTKLGEHWQDNVTQMRQIAYRFQEQIQIERKQYWTSQMQLAERNLQAAREAMLRANLANSDDGVRNTEAEILVAKAKRRVRVCLQKLSACKRIARETDRVVDRFVGELGAMSEMAESGLPNSANRLALWIDALDVYADNNE